MSFHCINLLPLLLIPNYLILYVALGNAIALVIFFPGGSSWACKNATNCCTLTWWLAAAWKSFFFITSVFSGVFRVLYINGHACVPCRQRWSVLPPPHIFALVSFLVWSFNMNSVTAIEVFAEGRHPALLLILRGKISIFPMQWCSCWVFHRWSFSFEVVSFCSHFVKGFYHERPWNYVKCSLHISWDNIDWLLEVSITLGVYILLQIFNWSDSSFYAPHGGDRDSDTVWEGWNKRMEVNISISVATSERVTGQLELLGQKNAISCSGFHGIKAQSLKGDSRDQRPRMLWNQKHCFLASQ